MASVVVVRSSPLISLVRCTVALGMTAPEGSVTVPRTVPALPLCADAHVAAKSTATRGRMRGIARRMNGMDCLLNNG